MVGGEVFLNAQGPKAAKKWEDGGPGQLQITVAEDLSAADPSIDRRQRASQDGVEWLRRIQFPKPAAERGRVGHAMGILHRRCRRFPATVLDKVAPQRLTAGDQAVMRVRERKPRQEGDRLAARLTDASPDRNPVMIFIMSLFAPPTMANDRVQQTNWALADQFFCACLRPIGWQVALRCGKRDKDNRVKWGSAPGGADLAEVMTLERSPPLLKRINWKRISNFRSARSGFVGGPAIGRSIVSPFGSTPHIVPGARGSVSKGVLVRRTSRQFLRRQTRAWLPKK